MTATWRWAAVVALGGVAACGGRVLAEDGPESHATAAAGGGTAGGDEGGAPSWAGASHVRLDAGLDASSGRRRFALDGGIPWDALPMPEGGPASDCLGCAVDSCRKVIDICAEDEACLVGMICVALDCLETEDPACPTQCFEGQSDVPAAGAVAAACVIDHCEQSCRATTSLADASDARHHDSNRAGAGGLEQ